MGNKGKTNKKRVLGIIDKIVSMASDGEYIYRGQSDTTYYLQSSGDILPQVTSTLYRAMTENCPEIIGANWLDMNLVQEEMLKSARKFTSEDYDKDNEKMLSRIQHYSGDTNLIDFTKDCYVALFFACSQKGGEEGGKDGRVFLLKTSNLKNSEIEIVTSAHPSNRVTAQKSVFVQSRTGIIRDDMMDSVEIPLDLKQHILDYLRAYHGISEYSIYNDLHGYIRNCKAHGNAVMEFYFGVNYGDKGGKLQSSEDKDEAWGNAIEHFNKAIQVAPNFATAYYNRGVAKSSLGDVIDAISDYSKSIELHPDYLEAYNNRGVLKRRVGDIPGAISDYDKAIELGPDNAVAYNNRGFAKKDRGNAKRKLGDISGSISDYKDAINDYNKAIGLNPDYSEAYNNRGIIREKLSDVSGAISDYDKAIVLNPDYAAAYYNRGLAKSKSGDNEGVLSDCGKAITLNLDYAAAYYNRGLAKRKLGDVPGAINDYNKAIALDPDYVGAYLNRGIAFTILGNFQQALLDLENVKKLALQQNNQNMMDKAQRVIDSIIAEMNKS